MSEREGVARGQHTELVGKDNGFDSPQNTFLNTFLKRGEKL